jgi:hypothetical protein
VACQGRPLEEEEEEEEEDSGDKSAPIINHIHRRR